MPTMSVADCDWERCDPHFQKREKENRIEVVDSQASSGSHQSEVLDGPARGEGRGRDEEHSPE
jgi:hypothetical protein